MSRRVHRSAAALVVCAALALSACSSDGDDEADATTTTEAGDDTATSVPQPVGPSTSVVDDGSEPDPAAEAVRERAESRNLTIDDFPSGWQSLPPSEAEVSVVELCTTVDLDEHLLAQVRSDGFSYTIDPGTLQASSAVTVLDSEAAATDLLDDFRDDAFVRCATDALSQDTDTYDITGGLARNDSEPGLGDESVALSGDFVITPTDGTPPHSLSAVVVGIRKGDSVVTFSTTAVDRNPDEQVIQDLLTTLDQRLGA